jgi:hypothetical protein
MFVIDGVPTIVTSGADPVYVSPLVIKRGLIGSMMTVCCEVTIASDDWINASPSKLKLGPLTYCGSRLNRIGDSSPLTSC